MTGTNPLRQLKSEGQSLWLDNLSRPLVENGDLQRLIDEDGLSGVTSNPKIFMKAITGSDAYDEALREACRGNPEPKRVYEKLAVGDVRRAADLLRGIHESTFGDDGYVSLEVSPHLARSTRATVEEAARLWEEVDRPNVFIKIPATEEGIPAIRTCLARGININVTLLFSLSMYQKVAEAYLDAVEERSSRKNTSGGRPVRSVASFFLSRIDSKVDPELRRACGKSGAGAPAEELLGQTAIASARMAYQRWKESFSGPRWERLSGAGLPAQKLLWASTSTKNPDDSDVKYIEALIGPRTITTMPGKTMDAFRDHGKVAPTLERDLELARKVLEDLPRAGVDLEKANEDLVQEGIRKFSEPFDELLKALEGRIRQISTSAPSSMT